MKDLCCGFSIWVLDRLENWGDKGIRKLGVEIDWGLNKEGLINRLLDFDWKRRVGCEEEQEGEREIVKWIGEQKSGREVTTEREREEARVFF